MHLRLVPKSTNWDFFSIKRQTSGVSIAALCLSVIFFFLFGLNFGIDFRGGTTLRAQTPNSLQITEYRAALNQLDLGDILITAIYNPTQPDKNTAQIRISSQQEGEAISSEIVNNIANILNKIDPDLKIIAIESIGPKVSDELIKTAIIAVILAISAVLIYIWLRFEWQFALGAVGALIHDVVLTIGIFSLLQIKFDLAIIAAILTIIGYSLNDTVVVFDRIRENLRKYKSKPLKDVLNMSINETLSRTIMTSFTTLVALFALFILGGDILRGFVFAMILGVFVGTYSSVFVASTILLYLGLQRINDKRAMT